MAYDLRRSLVERQVVIPYVQNCFRDLSTWPSDEAMALGNPNKHDSNEDDYWHPSVHSSECALGCYLRLHPIERTLLLPEEQSFTSLLTPFVGTFIHKVIQQKMILDGYVEESDVEVPMLDEVHHWKGHADLIFKEELCDIKVMKQDKYKYTKAPLDSWRNQLTPYMDSLGKKTCLILLVELGWPYQMREFRIDQDPARLEEIYNKWDFVSDCIKADTPPSHEGCENKYCTVRQRLSDAQKLALKE